MLQQKQDTKLVGREVEVDGGKLDGAGEYDQKYIAWNSQWSNKNKIFKKENILRIITQNTAFKSA